MSFMHGVPTKKANKKHWGRFKLIPKNVASTTIRKTKNVIVEAKIASSKINHKSTIS